MKYKNFLSIGLTVIALSKSVNLVNAKEVEPIKDSSSFVQNSNLKLEQNKAHHKAIIKKKDNSFNNVLKITAFTALGTLGIGVLGLGYFFIRLVDAGKPIFKKSDKKKNQDDFLVHCFQGNLDKVKDLLTKKAVNIHCEQGLAIQRACVFGHLPIVKYLLTSPELKKHSDIHVNSDYSFKGAYENGHNEIIQYLIFNYKIKKTKEIQKFLEDNEDLKQMFEKRELFKSLNKDFDKQDNTKINNKKNKI